MAFPLGACSFFERASRLRTAIGEGYPADAANSKPAQTRITSARQRQRDVIPLCTNSAESATHRAWRRSPFV